MSERAGTVDETTMKFDLLMESAQAHQKMAECHLEKLRAHTQDLDGVVREEIRRTLVEELDELTAESRRAAQALKGMKRAAHLRGLVFSVSTRVAPASIGGIAASERGCAFASTAARRFTATKRTISSSRAIE